MTDPVLLSAQARRDDVLLAEQIDQRLDVLLSSKTVGPEARMKLRNLLAHYAKQPHPFRACVTDNMKRFGPGRTEAVCATLKDIIKGTTRWRHGAEGATALSDVPEIDNEVIELIESISASDLEELMEEVMTHA